MDDSNSREQMVTVTNRVIVEVADIDMKFWSMVSFLVKLAVAAIPAMLFLMFFVFALYLGVVAIGKI